MVHSDENDSESFQNLPTAPTRVVEEDVENTVKKSRASDVVFVQTWQAANSAAEAADALDIAESSAMSRAARLRKAGVDLKKFKPKPSFGRQVRDEAYFAELSKLAAESFVDGENVLNEEDSESSDV